ncbi:hypothetical protein ACFL2A_06745 [Thermodesulfobacteriota bacterium]
MYCWIVAIIILYVVFSLFTDFLPSRQYSLNAACVREWNKQFPTITNDDIRRFFNAFTESFLFKDRHKLTFNPSDKILDVYREAQTSPDAYELEMFCATIKYNYGIDLEESWHDDMTLAQVFELAIKG